MSLPCRNTGYFNTFRSVINYHFVRKRGRAWCNTVIKPEVFARFSLQDKRVVGLCQVFSTCVNTQRLCANQVSVHLVAIPLEGALTYQYSR